ncbi:hypothetical protein EDC04DRAFT_2603042 [Pisolithus marmoratus]|nr:hypothetical protein EDC04DRAFT_2603042 [Pisolithus marmoratus]
MTSFPMIMNGAYSHESKQLGLLQEHMKFLKGQVMKLTIENNTLRMAFQCLAGAISLCDMDPSQVDVKAIWKLLCGGWVELVHEELTPPSWGRLSTSACQFIHGLMETTYPHFKFTNNGWKLNYLASNTYPAWQKGNLDNSRSQNGDLKMEEDDDNDDDDNSLDEIGRKWKVGAIKLEESVPEKQFKDCKGNMRWKMVTHHPPQLVHSCPLLPMTVRLFLPILTLCMSSEKAVINTQPILELEHANLPAVTPMPSMTPTMVDNAPVVSVNKCAKGGSKGRMCPGPAKNGCNLCAYHWCKQVPLNGMTKEFQKYYLGLTSAQQQVVQAYDADATALAASNNWDMKTICNSTLH